MSSFTFLTDNQVNGNNQLDIFKKYGTKCAITDFSILLGGYVSSGFYTSEGNSLKDRTGWWWLKTQYGNTDARAVRGNGYLDCRDVDGRYGGARPALPYSQIRSISTNVVSGIRGLKEVEYGEYPQSIVSENISRSLENLYSSGKMARTGKSYTTDSVSYRETETSFKARKHIEYQFNGKKYIRFVGDSNCSGETLSDGRIIENGKAYWVEVEPIRWLVDEKANLAVTKKIIFSGVQFNKTRNYNGDFSRTDINKFLENCFEKEIVSNQTHTQTQNLGNTNEDNKTSQRKQNPYNFDFDDVSEEDIIKGAVESGIAVLLHGRSSDGKSARVKQIDPDCEIIYLRNATPESLNGKSVYNQETGQMIDIPPTWYKKIKQKCEEEPNKIHIVFFDEITNAYPAIQGMAFNIILDREVNGMWKLPENCRIVAAGNEIKDSLAANEMAEPLFNRFAHVYINTTVDSWLKWASTPEEEYKRLDYEKPKKQAKIHPAIYSYISYKSFKGEDVLRTEYNGETPNADPRKWEMASKVLYKTKKPEMLRALIGQELTMDFINFCKQQVITVDDVINNNYSESDLNMNLAEKYATAVGLSSVDELNFKKVREFMKKIGPEPKAAFETMWARGEEKRLEIIAELEMVDNLSQGGKRR